MGHENVVDSTQGKVEAFPDIQTYRASWANILERQTTHDQNPKIQAYHSSWASKPEKFKNTGKWFACVRQVMDARGRLLSRREAKESYLSF